MAKYCKGGALFDRKRTPAELRTKKPRSIKNPSLRDNKKYIDVLMGKKQSFQKEEEVINTIPISITIQAAENEKTVKMLHQAIIVENSEIINITKAKKEVPALTQHIKGMYYLSPTRIMIVFDCLDDAKNAVAKEIALWTAFDDIRPWSEGELFDDRLVWLECYGLHPKGWSEENIKKIGECWGPVIDIENDI